VPQALQEGYVSQLAIAITKYLSYSTKRKKSLFGLTVSKVLVHVCLVLLLWGLYKAAHGVECGVEHTPVAIMMAGKQIKKEEEKSQSSVIHFKGPPSGPIMT
jgi:hypothetical protein